MTNEESIKVLQTYVLDFEALSDGDRWTWRYKGMESKIFEDGFFDSPINAYLHFTALYICLNEQSMEMTSAVTGFNPDQLQNEYLPHGSGQRS